MSQFLLAPCVEEELWEIWQFIAKDNPEAASKVLEAAYTTIKDLAHSPFKGKVGRFKHPALKDIRSFRVSGFDSYVIFYRPCPVGFRSFTFSTEQEISRLSSMKSPDLAGLLASRE